MKKLYLIITLSLLLLSCTEEKEVPEAVNVEIASIDNSLPTHDRPSIDTLNEFMEISDTIRLDEKLFRYSIFLPITFDTVFVQGYGGCTFSTERIVFTNSLYHIIPSYNTYLGVKISDSLYSVAIETDTSEIDFTINEDYQTKVDEMRNSNPQLTDDRMDSSYLYIQNGIARYRYELTKPGVQSRIRLQFIYKDVLITIVGKYILGMLATEKLSEMRTIIQSFEVEEVKPPFNETVLQLLE